MNETNAQHLTGLVQEPRWQTALLDALPANIALLDAGGVILAVNKAWRRFAHDNGLRHAEHGVGLNYLDVCDQASGADAALAAGPAGENIEVFASGDSAGSIAATVDVAERLGDIVLLYLKVPGIEQTLAVKVPEEGRQWQRGAAVALRPREKTALLFSKAGPRVF